jgi:hypothetical protein
MHRLLSAVAAAAAVMTFAIIAHSPAAAQSAPVYDFTQLNTPVGPLAVAYRRLLPSERGAAGWTHEILFAHPIWAYGVHRGKYSSDCNGGSGSQAGVTRWDGSKFGEEFERRIDQAIEQLLTYETRNNLFDAILCGSGPMRLNATRVEQSAITARLMPFAGPHREAWRLHTITSADNGRTMRFAAPQAENVALVDGTDFEITPGRTWGAQILTYTTDPGVRASHAIDHLVRESGVTPLRRRTIVNSSAYQLEQIVTDQGDGVFQVNHALVCLNRPGVVYGIFAEYKGLEQEQLALRFVNSMEVWC